MASVEPTPSFDHQALPLYLNSASPLAKLPYELIENVCSFLPSNSVAMLGCTCRKFHKVINDDVLWKKRFMSLNLPDRGDSHSPFESWRDLYLAHHPYWFIPQRKIWYADGTELDGGFCGQLLIARYQPHSGNIEGYALVGEQGQVAIQPWAEMPGVNIHVFHPRVRLHLAQPILRLRPMRWKEQDPERITDSRDGEGRSDVSSKGLQSLRIASNDLNFAHQVTAHVMLARAIEPSLQHPSMRLWPPARLPAIDRVRRHSPSMFSRSSQNVVDQLNDPRGSSYNRPTKYADVCQSAFRYQRQLAGRMAALFQMLNRGGAAAFGGDMQTAMAMSAGVATYSTLPEDAYVPTPDRPYQGIWVGDYAGHGCEFLIIRQKITREEIRLSEKIGPKVTSPVVIHPNGILADFDNDQTQPGETPSIVADGDDTDTSLDEGLAGTDDDEDDEFDDAEEHIGEPHLHVTLSSGSLSEAQNLVSDLSGTGQEENSRRPKRRQRFHSFSEGNLDDDMGEIGRLEAIKLTGDANVPRGEYTFVAEEIGRKGQVYVGQTGRFKDKRAVHCWGHIAAHGFTEDVYVKTDLILVSHDCLAQHWHEFGHVAFYRRVDVDKLFTSDNVELAL